MKLAFPKVMMKPISYTEKFEIFQEKLKPIPRHHIPNIYHPHYLDFLILKGLKVKNMILKEDGSENPQNLSKLRRLTRYGGSMKNIRLKIASKKDVSLLLKIQNRIRNIKHFEAEMRKIIFDDWKTQKKIQRFFFRSKFIQNYKASHPEIENLPQKSPDKRVKISFKFHLKNTNSRSYNRPQRLITALSGWLSPLFCIKGNQDSIIFEAYLFANTRCDEFHQDIKMINKGLRRVNFLDSVTIPSCWKEDFYKFLPLLKVKDLKVSTPLDVALFVKKDFKGAIENFISRKDAKLTVWLSNYSWSNFLELLRLSQEMNCKYNSCFSFEDFTFDFHSPLEVRTALINYFSNMKTKWRSFAFIFKTNSLDWFNFEKKSELERMIDEICKERNKAKYDEINFNIAFTTGFSDELLAKVLMEISSVIQNIVKRLEQSKSSIRCVLKIETENRNEQSLSLFLKSFQQIPIKIDCFQPHFQSNPWRYGGWRYRR